jgi:hypothetical protein
MQVVHALFLTAIPPAAPALRKPDVPSSQKCKWALRGPRTSLWQDLYSQCAWSSAQLWWVRRLRLAVR